MLEYGTMQNI